MTTFIPFPDNYTKTPQLKTVDIKDLQRLVKLKNQMGGKYTLSQIGETVIIKNDKDGKTYQSKNYRSLWNNII